MASFAVLFDIDGLMLDSERMAIGAWRQALAERGFILNDVSAELILGLTVQDTAKILEADFGAGWPYAEVYARRLEIYEADIDTNGIPIKPGLMELIDFVEANQIRKAVASSTPCWFAKRKLARTALDTRFEVVVCGDMVANGKPAPDLFLQAARQIAMPPERCLVLEDSEPGIIAARAAGMVPLMIPDLKQPNLEIRQMAYRVLPTLFEVIPLVEGFLKEGLP
jgi:HAD superfamily hydrolase (TIGR01509 family)